MRGPVSEDPFGWLGSTIDAKYAVQAVVGEGGFGVVYRAAHVTLGDTVAVKCLKLPASFDGAARDGFRRSFMEEGRLLRQLSRATTGIVQALVSVINNGVNGATSRFFKLHHLSRITTGTGLLSALLGHATCQPRRVVDEALRRHTLEIAKAKGIRAFEGVYSAMSGPNLETPAEYTMLRSLGSDCTGMSSIPEVLVARHSGLPVLMISLISNVSYPRSAIHVTTLEEVISTAQAAEPKMRLLIRELVSYL